MTSPHAMNLYRARITEVRAVDLGDGRHVILGEAPRYVASAEFLAAYELVPERRVTTRRVKNGRGRGKKPERRKSVGRRMANGDNPKKAEAKKLFEGGESVKAISAGLEIPYATVYGWSRKEKWKAAKRTPAPAPRTPGRPARSEKATAAAAEDEGLHRSWMD